MDVFISYRRDGGYALARLLYEWLRKENISAFLDLEELRSGPFNEKLYSAIEDCQNFVLVLPARALDRCVNENDWLRLEIEHAIKNNKNIVPLMADGFSFPDELPDSLKSLPYYNGVPVTREYFDASMEKLISMLKNVCPKNASDNLLTRHEDVRYYLDDDEQERHRLHTEDTLLWRYEEPVVKKLLEGRQNLVCLEVNVLNPESAMQRLEYPEVSKVIALTYDEAVEKRGNEIANSEKVRFFKVKFESDDLESQIEKCLEKAGVSGVDFVCLSMAIMDFKKPFRVLQAIGNCINDDAVMLIRDVDDGAVFAYPDKDGYFKKFQSFYIHDKFSGFRYTGRQIFSYLKRIGAKAVCLDHFGIDTADMSRRDKKALFESWFSFIPNDFKRMLNENPEDKIAKEVIDFCNEYYDDLYEQFFSNDTIFSAGYVIYSAKF